MEEKLTAYRRLRKKEEFWNKFRWENIMEKFQTSTETNEEQLPDTSLTMPNCSTPPPLEDNISIASSNGSTEISLPNVSKLTLVTYCLYFLLWITVFMIAIQLAFGAVYLVLSGLVAIYLNTRTTPRKKGELSAYSVFNPKCESLDGTLKAEHFEKNFGFIIHSPNTI